MGTRWVRWGAAWAAVVGMALSGAAHAQEGFDAHGFHLAPHDADLRDPLVVQRPGPFTQGDFFASGLAEFAKAPLVEVTANDAGVEQDSAAVLDNVVALNIGAGVAAHDHVRFDIKAPIYGVSTSLEQGTEGPAFGDVRLSTMLIALRPEHVYGGGGPGLGLVGHIDLPSGDDSRFLGQGGVAGGATLAFTYEFQRSTISANVGGQFNPSIGLQNLEGRDNLITSLALGAYTSDTVALNLEVVGQPPLQSATFEGASTAFPAESLVSLKYLNPTGAYWTFGAAAGLTDGPGVATFRVFLGGGFGKAEPPRAADSDTIGTLRSRDLCPLEVETVNGWRDDDGCPDSLGQLTVDVRYNGMARGADAVITGPDGTQETQIGPQGLSLTAVPGSQWTVRATSACLVGEGSTEVGETGGEIAVDLQPDYGASVRVVVVGGDNAPVPDAQVVWSSETPECIPQGTMIVDPAGVLEQPIARGNHHITVTSPAHNVFEQDVSFAAGDHKVIEVKLGASKVVLEKKQIRILEKVLFETAKDVIRPESFGLLDEVAATIITNPDIGIIEVSGHTDARGSDEYNKQLSERRAASVMAYLQQAGVQPERLTSIGHGEDSPIDTNKTAEGRERNRRVEFNIIDQLGAPGEEAP